MIEPAVEPRGWTSAHKLGFRFVAVYLLLYNLPFPLDAPPKMSWLDDAWTWIWHHVGVFTGDHVFGVDITTFSNGSGDTTYDYVMVFVYAAIAGAAAVAWTALDRRRADYRRLDGWLRVFVRYALGLTMLGYGAAKVFHTQFPFPTQDSLQETYGESSPMGLLWRMMGYSSGYNLFTGGVEVVGGLMLLWRRTALLGALVTAGALVNIVMLNLCFDVPVKLFSTHLLLMSVYVMAPDLGRLGALLVFNRPVAARPVPAPLGPRLRWGRRVLKYGLIGYSLYELVSSQLEYRDLIAGEHPPAITGVWNVDEVVVDGAVAAPLLTNGPRWRTISVNDWGGVMVRHVDGSSERFGGAFDPATHLATWAPYTSQDDKPGVVLYGTRGVAHMTLVGFVGGHAMIVRASKKDAGDSLLVSRGFHWINEFPLNR